MFDQFITTCLVFQHDEICPYLLAGLCPGTPEPKQPAASQEFSAALTAECSEAAEGDTPPKGSATNDARGAGHCTKGMEGPRSARGVPWAADDHGRHGKGGHRHMGTAGKGQLLVDLMMLKITCIVLLWSMISGKTAA